MAAMGMCQSHSPLGFSAFLGKMEISDTEKKQAIQLLTQYGMKHCDKVAALRKLSSNIKVKVVQNSQLSPTGIIAVPLRALLSAQHAKGKDF